MSVSINFCTQGVIRLINWDTDKIIGTGLIAALLVKIIGDFIIMLITGSVPNSDLATNIVACLAGYMGRSLAEKLKKGSLS